MLVLSRKLSETIVINGDIRVTVVGIRGNQVRLGIEAPATVGIFREELCAHTGASVRERPTSPSSATARGTVVGSAS
jgi:carbon storage regulator